MPIPATIVTGSFDNGARELLVVEPHLRRIVPPHYTKPVARSNFSPDKPRGFLPPFALLGRDDTTLEIAPVDLNLHIRFSIDESSEGGSGRYFARVEFTFRERRS